METPALEVVKRSLGVLKRIGTPKQQREAEEIEHVLQDRFGERKTAVNFSRRRRVLSKDGGK